MTLIKKILKYTAYIFLTLLVSLCIYTFISTDIIKKDYANVFGYTYFVVTTGSMSGTIEVNDFILIKVTKDVEKNDIVTFKGKEGEYITHRVQEVVGNRIVTKGDSNNVEDDPISKDAVIGKVKMIISPSFILKTIAIFIILFIALALINFDKIFKKYILRDRKNENKNKDIIFKNEENNTKEDKEKIDIPVGEIIDFKMNKEILGLEKEQKEIKEAVDVIKEEKDEVIDIDDEVIDTDDNVKQNVDEGISMDQQKLIEQVINLLKIKNKSKDKTSFDKKWITIFEYIYKLANIVKISDMVELVKSVSNPPFEEIYDYDLEEIGLYENLRNKIYDMPIYVFLKLLTFACLYNDEEIFDGIYKILKYKVQLDKENYFKKINPNDVYGQEQLNAFITLMEQIDEKYDKDNIVDLERIERYVSLKKYVNED